MKQLLQTPAAFFRIRVGEAHGVLSRVPVSQAGPPANLDKGREAGEEDIDFSLIQIPDIQAAVHVFVGRMHPEHGKLLLPESPELLHGPIHPGGVIFFPGGVRGLRAPAPQIEEEAGFLAGSEGQGAAQGAHGIAAVFHAAGEDALLHPKGISFGTVRTQEGVPGSVEIGGRLIGGEEMRFSLLVFQIAEDGPLLIAGAGAVKAHLEILLIKGYMMEGKLDIADDTQAAGPAGLVFQPDVKNLHRIRLRVRLPGNQQRLGGADPPQGAFENRITEPVTAGISGDIGSGGLPGQGPVGSAFLIPKINPMAGAVHRHAVGAETGDPSVFRSIQPAVSTGLMAEDGAHSLGSQIIGQGPGTVHPIHHVFPAGIVKKTVSHGAALLFVSFCLHCIEGSGGKQGRKL